MLAVAVAVLTEIQALKALVVLAVAQMAVMLVREQPHQQLQTQAVEAVVLVLMVELVELVVLELSLFVIQIHIKMPHPQQAVQHLPTQAVIKFTNGLVQVQLRSKEKS
jgi:hypothetical protein